MRRRIDSLRETLHKEGLEGYLVSNGANMLYLTGFEGGSRLLISADEDCILYVHRVNYDAAEDAVKDCEVRRVDYGDDLERVLARRIESLGLKSLGFDVMDAQTYMKMEKLLRETELKPRRDVMWALRKVKGEDELELLRKAAEITSMGMKKALEIVEDGMVERELAAEIDYEMRKLGSEGTAFETIVASGPNSAYPHGGRGDRRLKRGDLIVIDIGARYRGYCSDMTRTVTLGEASPRKIEIYEAVKEAREKALRIIRGGVKAREVDAEARRTIAEKGYGERFLHGLGHGVGLEVHEPPMLNPKSEDVLTPGNVVTVEPGIYIRGFGGVRIEDTVLVLEEGVEVLTRAPYQLVVR